MKCLLIVDVQNDFCEGGALEVKGSNAIIPIINDLITEFKNSNDLIVGTMDWHPATHKSFAKISGGVIGEIGELDGVPQIWWPEHCIQNTFGAQLHENLNKIDNIIYKGTEQNIDSYSGFFDNGKKKSTLLHDFLQKNHITSLYVVGIATDYCVKFTVMDALDLGYKVYVITDACKGVNINKNDSKNSLQEMENKGAILI